MKIWRLTVILETVVFLIGVIFLWFRKIDGSGITNSNGNRATSIGIWIFLFLIMYVGDLIWMNFIRKQH
ncbi:hypothetical protein CCS05_05265 [Levilactobacillus brevis]|jgi:hypothetical protein|uniref:DUF3923 family protein n=1 Tax=Levilactobacillus brevis TaxID=1580 RepID=UPI000A20C19C|nr:hypothetical protein AZI09_04590 [Levilactobacillus brevis]ARN97421.1 hypothetical protein AZI10_04585 [Levilactobacillus brevis]ARN97473.1 hypothetical protein AZI10_04925 [Levilactobacillus brevis]AWP46363.1 hypothetical protein CCS05_05265 [Levilactobacillus brevis]